MPRRGSARCESPLHEDEILTRAKALADGDRSGFPPAERLALRFARTLTAEPWAVTDDDVRALTGTFGRHRAIDVIWQVAWGNDTTRIADAFQLPLETTNVLEPPKKRRPLTATRDFRAPGRDTRAR